METASNSYSTLTEEEFFELWQIQYLAPLRIRNARDWKDSKNCNEESNPILFLNSEEAIRILLSMAKSQGQSQPESELITESFLLFINKDGKYYQTILDGLNDQSKEASARYIGFFGRRNTTREIICRNGSRRKGACLGTHRICIE
jgi:hypothetical protein